MSGKVWVVTGAGGGIGRELAVQLVERGARVAAVDLRPEGLQETAAMADAGDRLSLHVLDITDPDAVAALPAEVIGRHGAVDGLINNAGIMQQFVTVEQIDYATVEHLMDVNFMGAVRMVKAFLPHLRARPEASIVNVSSMGGFFPFPGQSMYGASKAALALFTEALYAELLDTPVRVTLVYPGAVDTQIAANSGVEVPGADAEDPKMKLTPAAEAAHVILDGAQRERLVVYIGTYAKMMGLAMKVAPARAIRFVSRQLKQFLDKEPASAGA